MAEKQALRAVLFDLDMTLVESKDIYVLGTRDLLRDELGVDYPVEEAYRQLGTPSPVILSRYYPAELVEQAVQRLTRRYPPYYATSLHVFPGVMESLQVLRAAGLKIGVVTSQAASELDGMRKYLPFVDWIDTWVTCDSAGAHKPHPAPVNLALQRLGVGPTQAVMVGDALVDLQAGQAAGVQTAAALWGAYDRPGMKALAPDFCFEQPVELAELADLADSRLAR